jgi:hypothetical protein
MKQECGLQSALLFHQGVWQVSTIDDYFPEARLNRRMNLQILG